MANREFSTLPDIIAEAREMQVNGQYINGTIFHAMADEIDLLRESLEEIVQAATLGSPPWAVVPYDLIEKAKAVLANKRLTRPK